MPFIPNRKRFFEWKYTGTHEKLKPKTLKMYKKRMRLSPRQGGAEENSLIPTMDSGIK
jgi:hypothetical protein